MREIDAVVILKQKEEKTKGGQTSKSRLTVRLFTSSF